MNTRSSTLLTYLILLAAQIIICNYLNLSQFVTINVLPVMILMLPVSCSGAAAMLTAFLTGLAVDLLGDGVIGLNAFALVPVALCRRGVIRAVFGNEIFGRKEDLSAAKYGIGKMLLAALIMEGLFMLLYVWADGAGSRPLWHNALRILLSTALCTLIAPWIAGLMSNDRRE